MSSHLVPDQLQVAEYTNIVYYNDDHSKTSQCAEKMRDRLNVTYSTPSTWHDLVDELEQNARFLIFHADNITRLSHTSATEFIAAVRAISKFIPACKNLAIGVIIIPNTPLNIIQSLQRSGVQGILLDCNYYTVEEIGPGANAFINKIPYWPKNILDSLPKNETTVERRPLSLYFRHNYTPCLSPVDREKFESELEIDVAYCGNWNEVSAAMADRPLQIIVHYDTIRTLNASIPEVVTMLETELKIRGLTARIGVGIDRSTTLETVKELKRAGIHGIVPSVSNWGIRECVTAVHALRDGESYWPKHIISTLPGNAKKKTTDSGISLTPRQQQVFEYIVERGASNKVIARSLGISESAVKLHVTEIMRKHGVKNRTQLAVFSRESA